MNLDRQKLETRLDEISNEIDKLYDEQSSIQKQLRIMDEENWKITNDILNIKPGTIIVSIARHEDYHYDLFNIFVINEIKDKSFIGNEFRYRFDDYEYRFSRYKFEHHISLFDELKTTRYLYNISSDQFNELTANCLNINLDYKALQEYKDKFHFHNNGALEIKT